MALARSGTLPTATSATQAGILAGCNGRSADDVAEAVADAACELFGPSLLDIQGEGERKGLLEHFRLAVRRVEYAVCSYG